MVLGSRLAEARKWAGLAQVELAVAMGDRYDHSMISQLETGKKSVRLDGLVNAAAELNVSVDWLLGLTDDPTPANLREGTREASESWGGIEQLAEVAAAAGIGAEVYDETVTAKVPFRRSWLRHHRINPAHCHVISVRGNSMEPTLPSECSIIVDRHRRELQTGHIYVMRTEEGLVVKRVRQNAQGWWLISDNPTWPPLFLTEETDIIGEVRWAGKMF